MKKNHKTDPTPDHPTEAILTPIAHEPGSGITIPGEANVRRAKDYVDENKK